jgi:hypothetical protein
MDRMEKCARTVAAALKLPFGDFEHFEEAPDCVELWQYDGYGCDTAVALVWVLPETRRMSGHTLNEVTVEFYEETTLFGVTGDSFRLDMDGSETPDEVF